MSEQDKFPLSNAGQPRDMTPEELEEALRWLEELAGRQGKSLDGLLTLDDTPLEDSPFKGLFDSDEQELPGWLREVPSAEDSVDEVIDGESRLDWLARMSGRESVEELPTLEWRRLTEGEEDEYGDLVDAMPEAAAAIAGLPAADVNLPPVPVEEMVTLAIIAPVPGPEDIELEPQVDEQLETPEVDLRIESTTVLTPILVDLSVLEEVEATESDVSLADEFYDTNPAAEQVEAGPDDLDEAMAWLEELAASQDAPVEDLPSVADRALASKLIADAASGISPVEGLDNSQIGIAMSGIYVGKTRLAPTGPLVGEPPADETPDSAIFAEVSLATDTDGNEDEQAELLLVSDQSTSADSPSLETVDSVETVADDQPYAKIEVTHTVVDDDTLAEFGEAIVVTEVISEAIVEEPVAAESFYEELIPTNMMNGSSRTLPELLLAVDRLAVPTNTSLDEINAMLAADPVLVKITPFSLESTLDWLAGGSHSDFPADQLDASLVAAMPDDPDEAQEWLEQLSEAVVTEEILVKGVVPAESVTSGSSSEAPISEIDLTEADLLDMPEDPDAAIAWIESLAARREGTQS